MNPDTQKTEEKETQRPTHMAWYVVAFLDLLGQQDVLSEITVLPNDEIQEEVNAFIQKVVELYIPLCGLERFFKASIRPFIEGALNEAAYSPSEQELLKQLRSTPIIYRHFSDSLIIHIPLSHNTGKFQCHAICGILNAAAVTFLLCLVNSWAVRGGIELGLAMDIEEGEVYGPALARAHRLESRVAKYPRIVIGEELVRYLEMVATLKVVTKEERTHALLAERSLRMLAVDDDGCTFLDWLGTDIRSTFQKREELVSKAYNFVIQESIKYKEARNSKLGFRYTLLRKYVESRLPDWGIRLQSE